MKQNLLAFALLFSFLPSAAQDCGERMEWRCLMIDSGRQYQTIETLESLVDLAADLGMNRLHWHLTEGLGWRLEIEQLPRLADVGAFVAKGEEQQGFYSADDVRHLVRYAAERGVEIVPEIDMPGHAEAALAAYPEWGCRGVAPEIPETGFTDNIFCAGNDSTIAALKLVLDAVCELFPSRFIHLGGDEAPKSAWRSCPRCQERIKKLGLSGEADLQLWFAAEMARHLEAKGRRAVFWEDVLYGEATYPLPENVVVQWWNYRSHSTRGLDLALERGLQVICSPNYYTYLNFPLEPWRGYGPERTFSLEDCYYRNPADQAFLLHSGRRLPDGRPALLGITCALWTDYGLTESLLADRLFPRVLAIAEIMRHAPAQRPSIEALEQQSAALRERFNFR